MSLLPLTFLFDSAPSRPVPAAMAPQKQQQQHQQRGEQKMSRTWTWVRRRRGSLCASAGPERKLPTLLSFPANVLLLAPARKRNNPDSEMLKDSEGLKEGTLLLFTDKGPLLLWYRSPFTQNSLLLSRCYFLNQPLFGCQERKKRSRMVKYRMLNAKWTSNHIFFE